MSNKKFFIIFLSCFFVICALFVLPTVYIDPFMHYHAPLEQYGYPLNKQRYQNDGITRHYTYDAIVAGTSMVEPFSITYANQAFGCNAIKLCYSGGGYKEINEALRLSLQRNPDVKTVIRGLDYLTMTEDKDYAKYSDLPTYLYNENPFDDVNYVLNKEVFFFRTLNVLSYTKNGGETTSMDDFPGCDDPFGKEYVLSYYERREKIKKKEIKLKDETRERELANVKQNVSSTIIENPDVDFYVFFSPYSILYWDDLYRKGKLKQHIEIERVAIEELLQYDNVHLFSFATDTNFNTALDNFRDPHHYNLYSTSFLIDYMKEGKYELTKDNYEAYLDELYNLYRNYDFDAILAN